MDKLDRIAAMEAQLAALKAEVKADEEKKHAKRNPVIKPQTIGTMHHLKYDAMGAGFQASSVCGNGNGKVKFAFRDKEAAEAYADAFNVMLELRACEGAIPYKSTFTSQWFITYKVLDLSKLTLEYQLPNGVFGPAFNTLSDAARALRQVGEERILKAIKTLAMQV